MVRDVLSMLVCKTLASATRGTLPNDFGMVDLHRGRLVWSSGRMVLKRPFNWWPWYASDTRRPDAPQTQSLPSV